MSSILILHKHKLFSLLLHKSIKDVHLCGVMTGSCQKMAASHLVEGGGALSDHVEELDCGWQRQQV